MRSVCTREKGFTLLELLIAMTLTVVLVVIMATALKSAVRAWGHGKERNRQRMNVDAVFNLLSRELSAALSPEETRNFIFHGEKESLRFVTRDVPLGSGGGGSFLVFIGYSDYRKSLIVGQRFVAVIGDVLAKPPLNASPEDVDELEELGWAVEFVEPFPQITFYYANPEDLDLPPAEWQTRWIYDRQRRPAAVAVKVKSGDEDARWAVFYTSRTLL